MRLLRIITIVLATLVLALALMPFGLLVGIKHSVLNPQFVIREINRIDLLEVAEYYLPANLPEGTSQYQSAFLLTIEQDQPWIKGQIQTIVMDSYSFLLNRTDEWSISIKTEGFINNLLDNLTATLEQSPTPEYAALSEAERQVYLQDLRSQIKDAVPESISLNRNDIPQDVWDSILNTRKIIGSIQTAYYGLIIILVLMIASLYLLYLNFKIPSRILGIVFAAQGLIGIIGFEVTGRVLSTTLHDMIPLIWEPYLPFWIKNILMPYGIFSAGLLVIGVGLLIISFLVRKRGKTAE
ncbi:MAG TPA: hypothetical protein VLH15_01385 [Dehalococcoidales bacterium]|nr:hypothetical protein [Dehalococcoidales bacterium]